MYKSGVQVSFHLQLLACVPYTEASSTAENAQPIDLVLTLGGDGTILHASSLFKSGAVPPVLSFSMGTLGFLLPFRTFDRPQMSSGR